MSIADKLEVIAGNVSRVYEAGRGAGYSEGYAAKKAECEAEHFATTILGDGSTALSVRIPFEPDSILVFSFDGRAYNEGVILFFYDIRSLGQVSGHASAAYGDGNRFSSSYGYAGMTNRYQQDEDGVITIQNVNTSSSYGYASFCQDVAYQVVAMKYESKTDKERIEELVASLDNNGGSLQINGTKVSVAFTDGEWAALIATKPNWTFTLK